MTDRPIIFSAPMINALMDGRKTQTRRILKPQPSMFEIASGVPCKVDICWDVDDGRGRIWKGCDRAGVLTEQTVPYGKGDRLWVRENWRWCGVDSIGDATRDFEDAMGPTFGPLFFGADSSPFGPRKMWPSIHMPRWASRLTLTVTDVRAQRLQEISEADAVAEGMRFLDTPPLSPGYEYHGPCWMELSDGSPAVTWRTACASFEQLWGNIHEKTGPKSWTANPWIIALTFTVAKANIDALKQDAA